jgi:hypothetical protein
MKTDGQIVISNAGKKSSDFDIKCSANSPLDLLKVIGMSQMEKELLKRYKSLVSKLKIVESIKTIIKII